MSQTSELDSAVEENKDCEVVQVYRHDEMSADSEPGGSDQEWTPQVKSVVKRVEAEHSDHNDELNKSLKVVMENPSALETVIKNVMPAFVMMSQQYAATSAGPSQENMPSTSSAHPSGVPVLARGESRVTDELQQLNIQDHSVTQPGGVVATSTDPLAGTNHDKQEVNTVPASVPVRSNESEVTVYRRG